MDAPIGININASRSGFHRELERLQDEVLVLGSMVEKALSRSVQALRHKCWTARTLQHLRRSRQFRSRQEADCRYSQAK